MKKKDFFLLAMCFIPISSNSGYIKILKAEYGFPLHGYKEATESLKTICENRQQCNFIVNNRILGKDPYPGNMKRLKIKAVCALSPNVIIPRNKQESVESDIYLELTELSIKCQNEDNKATYEIIRKSPYLYLPPVTFLSGVLGALFSKEIISPEVDYPTIYISISAAFSAYATHKLLRSTIYSIETCRNRT